ncbi:aldo/keto reductase [Streptomyces sp. NBC_00459]|uniref:aldo/keto reductase n=1 Tax=Streptomyces sp. NBC_00459 TaxID=2975749 RepID=UPI003FA71EC1
MRASARSSYREGVIRVGLCRLHRADAPYFIGESVSALDRMRREEKIERIGLSNVTASQIVKARSITSVDAVQNRQGAAHTESADALRLYERQSVPFFSHVPCAAARL